MENYTLILRQYISGALEKEIKITAKDEETAWKELRNGEYEEKNPKENWIQILKKNSYRKDLILAKKQIN